MLWRGTETQAQTQLVPSKREFIGGSWDKKGRSQRGKKVPTKKLPTRRNVKSDKNPASEKHKSKRAGKSRTGQVNPQPGLWQAGSSERSDSLCFGEQTIKRDGDYWKQVRNDDAGEGLQAAAVEYGAL